MATVVCPHPNQQLSYDRLRDLVHLECPDCDGFLDVSCEMIYDAEYSHTAEWLDASIDRAWGNAVAKEMRLLCHLTYVDASLRS